VPSLSLSVFRLKCVYFKTDSSQLVSCIVRNDGGIDFDVLGREFKLFPSSIKLNGFIVPRAGSKSECTWEELEELFKQERIPAGTEEDPVVVSGGRC